MSSNVLSDAQMGMFSVIRPPDGFEALYQGVEGTTPIAFPGTLDLDAGKPGYATGLLAGIPVPLGGRLLLQIPQTVRAIEGGGVATADYEYQLIWRTRNQASAAADISSGRRNASPYHLPNGTGRRESVFIPGASDVEVFEQGEPVALGVAATLNVKQQRYVPQITVPWVPPLLPDGADGVWQQGVYETSVDAVNSGPTWCPLWLDAAGDELLILVYKIVTDSPWDFAEGGDDEAFGNTYGTDNGRVPNNPNVGILLSSGTMGA